MRVYAVLLSVIISISYFHHSYSSQSYFRKNLFSSTTAYKSDEKEGYLECIYSFVIYFILFKMWGLETIKDIIPNNG